jgi:membrane fusion protein, multidrug efflux system
MSIQFRPASMPAVSELRLELSRKQWRRLLMIGGPLLVAVIASVVWLRGGQYVSADDAYVGAPKLMVSTDVSGLVTSVDVREGQVVKAGAVLFQIDPKQYEIALANAKANLTQTALTLQSMKQDYQRMLKDIEAQQSQVDLDRINYDRSAELVGNQMSVSKAQFDQTRYALMVDKNKLQSLQQQAQVQLVRLGGTLDAPVQEHPLYKQAQSQVDEAQRQLDHTTVRAPFDGIVTQVSALQPGMYLVASTAALTNTGAVALVSTDEVWVDANMKETDLTWVKLGDPVDVEVDTYPGRVWEGTVQSISPASASQFSLLPAQNASGNWVKIVQRIPLRVTVSQKPGDPPLRAGMSAVVTIDTGHRRSLSDL